MAVAITNDTIVKSFQDTIDDLSGSADLNVTSVSRGPFDESILSTVKKVEGVESAVAKMSKFALVDAGEDDQFLRVVGVEPGDDGLFRRYQFELGGYFSRGDEVLLERSWAKERGIKLGDKIKIAAASRSVSFKVAGLLKKIGPGAVDNGAVAFISLSRAQKLFSLPDKVTGIDVKSDFGDTKKVKRALKKELGDGYLVTRPSEKGAIIEEATKGVMGAFGSFGNLALFIGAFVVFNTMLMSVSERLGEIGALRLIGASRSQVFRVIIFETVIYGVIGSALGIGLGIFLGKGLAGQVGSIYNIDVASVAVPLDWSLLAFFIGVAASFVAGAQPALKASMVQPVEVSRLKLGQSTGFISRHGWILGILFISSGIALFMSPLKNDYGTIVFSVSSALIFLGASFFSVSLVVILNALLAPLSKAIFKVEGRLAKDSIDRGRSRTALAVVTLLASLSMIIAAGELRLADNKFLDNWMAAIIPFDLSIRTPLPMNVTEVNKYIPIDISLKDKILKVEGVAHVNPIKFELAKGLGRDLFIITTEGSSWKHTSNLKFDEGDRDKALDEFDKGGSVMISSTISRAEDLHAGDKIKMKTPSGWQEFEISGIFPEIANDGYVVYASRHDQIKFWKDPSVDGFDIALEPGADLDKTKASLEKLVAGISGLEVVTGKDIRDEIRDSVNQFLAILNALVVVAVIVTTLGIVNTLAMSVYERVREIGIVRAIGTSRRQVMKMVIAEAAIIGMMGAILGVVVGLAVSWGIVVIAQLVGGWNVPYVFPGNYLIAAVAISVFVTILASIYPARVAAKIDIVKAVQYE